MKQIKFSEHYNKFPSTIKTANLMAVININLEEQTTSFIKYDTLFYAEFGNPCYYELPKSGKYMVLCFRADSGAFFTTIRRHTKEKETYYRLAIGEMFEVVIA